MTSASNVAATAKAVVEIAVDTLLKRSWTLTAWSVVLESTCILVFREHTLNIVRLTGVCRVFSLAKHQLMYYK